MEAHKALGLRPRTVGADKRYAPGPLLRRLEEDEGVVLHVAMGDRRIRPEEARYLLMERIPHAVRLSA